MPSLHSTQSVFPVVAWCFPASHSAQSTAPVSLLCVPATHTLQLEVASDEACLPRSHSVHDAARERLRVPGGHAAQTTVPSPE